MIKKKKKKQNDPDTPFREKHPLEKPPAASEEQAINEEDIDKIPDEEEKNLLTKRLLPGKVLKEYDSIFKNSNSLRKRHQ